MLKIRLMRIGTNQRPFYRVVVIDERSKRNGAYVELLGTYNPLTEPKEIKLKQDRIDHWIKLGAQMSTGFLRIIGKAPQRKPRKPKKEKKESSVISPQPSEKTEEKPNETVTEQSTTETPAEESKEEAKSSDQEATGAVESTPQEVNSEDSTSQQTGSEAQEINPESKNIEPSGASVADEPTTTEEKK